MYKLTKGRKNQKSCCSNIHGLNYVYYIGHTVTVPSISYMVGFSNTNWKGERGRKKPKRVAMYMWHRVGLMCTSDLKWYFSPLPSCQVDVGSVLFTSGYCVYMAKKREGKDWNQIAKLRADKLKRGERESVVMYMYSTLSQCMYLTQQDTVGDWMSQTGDYK